MKSIEQESTLPPFIKYPDSSLYSKGSYVVLDFETTNLEKGSALVPENRIILACWTKVTAEGVEHKYVWGGEYELQELVDDINQVDFFVAQNAKFELQWLDRCGYDIASRPVYDTMLAEWVIAGNRPWRLNMDAIAARHGVKTKSKMIKLLMDAGISPADMPKSWLLKYCIDDVAITREIYLKQLKEMEGTRLLPIVYSRCLTTLALADIEKNGIHLDSAVTEEAYEKTLTEFLEVEKELDSLTGGINPNSPIQVAEYLYGKLGFKELRDYNGKIIRNKPSKKYPDGTPKADKDTIAKLEAKTPEQKKFLRLKARQGKLKAALSKTLDFFVLACREKGGTFYGELAQGRTATHRLASAGRPILFKGATKTKSCQLQNMPNKFKPLVAARKENWYVCEADGSQLEFRVGGHLGDDDQIKHDITNKEDIHRSTASAIYNVPESEVDYDMRRNSKKHTFKPMYGGTQGSEAVKRYCQFFAEKYHQLNKRQKAWAMQAVDKGFIETEWGMRYYFPKVHITRSGYISGQQQVFNYPIQAFATAEIIPIALVHFWYRTRNLDLIITNTVHDSIICEVPEHEIELFQTLAVQSLTTDVYEYLENAYGIKFSLPLGVGMKLGTHWSRSAFSDEELDTNYTVKLKEMGFDPIVDDGEITVDVNPQE